MRASATAALLLLLVSATITNTATARVSEWQQLGAALQGSSGDEFGWSVSLAGSGARVAVGAPSSGSGTGATAAGAGDVRVFERVEGEGEGGEEWVQAGSALSGTIAGEGGSGSGYALSLSADGARVAVGAPLHNETGAVQVFEYLYDKSLWLQLGDGVAGEASGSRCGHAVSLSADGTRVAVGAPYHGDATDPSAGLVRVYELHSDTWVQIGGDITGESGDESGWAVSLSSDGARLAVGAPLNGGGGLNAGRVLVYEYDAAAGWVQIGDDIYGEAPGDQSGAAISLSSGGNRLAIGAALNDGGGDNAGHVRIFEYNSSAASAWVQWGDDIDGEAAGERSGTSLSFSSSGTRVAVAVPPSISGGSTAGKLRMYDLDEALFTWVQVGTTIVGGDDAREGGTVTSLSADGTMVAFGSYYGADRASVWQFPTEPTPQPSAGPSTVPTVSPNSPLSEDDIGLCNLVYHTTIGSLLMTDNSWNCVDVNTPAKVATPICFQNHSSSGGTNSTWTGVYCRDGKVSALVLPGYGGAFSGNLPSSLGNMTSLTRLDLESNTLSATVPVLLSQLTALQELRLGENKFTGSVAGTIDLLSNLMHLDLHRNEFVGDPSIFFGLTRLTSLELAGNFFDGTISSDISNLVNLKRLDLGELQLAGFLPEELVTLTLLTYLNMRNNSKLLGAIPEEIGQLTNLNTLVLDNNRFNGTIPMALSNLIKLTSLQLARNELSGTLQSSIGEMDRLVNVFLDNNHFIGTIPSELGKLVQMSEFDATFNSLTGPIPSSLCELTLLSPLRVATGNSLSCVASCYSSTYLTLDLGAESLEECAFEPTVDEKTLCSIVSSSNVASLEFSGWDCLSSSEPVYRPICSSEGTWQGVTCKYGKVVAIDTSASGFESIAPFPSSLFGMTQLTRLDFSESKFLGPLQTQWGELVNLNYLDLSGSDATGTIPTSLGQLSALESLLLRKNTLRGYIPSTIGKLRNLAIIDIGYNQLTSSVPTTLGALSNLKSIRLDNNVLSGDLGSDLCPIHGINTFMVATNNSIRCMDSCFYTAPPGTRSSFKSGETDFHLLDICIEPSSVPIPLPSAYPSSFPSSSAPTIQPTVSEAPTSPTISPSSAFEGIDIVAELDSFVQMPERGVRYVSFDVILDDSTGYNTTFQQIMWQEFVAQYVATSLSVQYYRVDLFSASVSDNFGARTSSMYVHQMQQSCGESVTANRIVGNILEMKSANMSCGGVYWSTDTFQRLCAGWSCEHIPDPFCFDYSAAQVVPHLDCTPQAHKLATRVILYFTEVVVETVPKIDGVSVIPSDNHTIVLVTVSLDDNFNIGRVYCAAFAVDTVISSAQQVQNHYNVEYFSINSSAAGKTLLDQELVISGLVSVVDYSVYCYAQDLEYIEGGGSSLADILSTSTGFTTTCCRKIVNYFPSSISMAATGAFFSAESYQLDQYVFTFEVTQLPTDATAALVVTPEFRNADGNIAAGVKASPGDFTIKGSSNKFFSFVVSSALSGSFTLSLLLSGSAAHKYSSSSAAFKVVSELPQPPILSTVRFNSAGKVYFAFDSPTDMGTSKFPSMARSKFVCSRLFVFSQSSGASCLWINSTVVEAVISSQTKGQLLIPGAAVNLVGGVTRSYYCGSSSYTACTIADYSEDNQVLVSIMPSVKAPAVVITTQPTINQCSPVVIDVSSSTRSGGRAWTSFSWTVAETSNSSDIRKQGAATAIQEYLNSLDVSALSSTITVDIVHEHPAGSVYTIGLSLSNFLRPTTFASGVISIQVLFSESRLSPASVSIVGNLYRSFDVGDTFAISAVGSWGGITSCSQETEDYPDYTITYDWALFQNLVYKDVRSTSKSAKRFRLLPYSLEVGQSYMLEVKATITAPSSTGDTPYSLEAFGYANMFVTPGDVYTVISGGRQRKVSHLQPIFLDASGSYDEAFVSTSNVLEFTWSCQIVFPQSNFGESCGAVIDILLMTANDASSDSILIQEQLMQSNMTYEFTVRAQSPAYLTDTGDFRFGVYSVFIDVVALASNLAVDISSSFEKFNVNYPVQLDGVISGASGEQSEVAFWEIEEDGVLEGLLTDGAVLTPHLRNFSRAEINGTGISYPIQIAAHALTVGKSYTFRLSFTVSTQLIFSTIKITANIPPTSGDLQVNPPGGRTSKRFRLIASFWTDDAEDYPLQYSFTYRQYRGSVAVLPLQLQSEVVYTDTFLPAGLQSFDYLVELMVEVSDFFFASANATTAIEVRTADDDILNYTAVYLSLETSLEESIDVNNFNLVLQDIQFYTSTIVAANCSLAPNCTLLSREACTYTANTCGRCKTGTYASQSSSANTPCVPQSATALALEDRALISKACPSVSDSVPCSGHGNCVASGQIEPETLCLENNPYCLSTCSCDIGYFGTDCSLDADSANYLDLSVRAICSGLVEINDNEDDSSYRFNLVVDTLLELKPSYIITSTTEECYVHLVKVTSDILLDSSIVFYVSTEQIKNLVTIVSNAIDFGTIFSDSSLALLQIALDNAITGQLNNIADGQYPVYLTTDNVQVVIEANTISSTANATYSPVSTADKVYYGQAASAITFPASGLSSCDRFSDKYARLVVGESKISMRLNSTNTSNTTIASKALKIGAYVTNSSLIDDTTVLGMTSSSVATYTIVLQLHGEYFFEPNVSVPGCSMYDTASATFLDCPCSVVGFTTSNVTLQCEDRSVLCPVIEEIASSVTASKQHLGRSRTGRARQYGHDRGIYSQWQRRRLDFDYEGTEDDGYGNDYSAGDFVVLVSALGDEFFVFGSFPWQKSIVSLIFIFCLMGFLLWGIFVFVRWDEVDRNQLIYVPNDQSVKGIDLLPKTIVAKDVSPVDHFVRNQCHEYDKIIRSYESGCEDKQNSSPVLIKSTGRGTKSSDQEPRESPHAQNESPPRFLSIEDKMQPASFHRSRRRLQSARSFQGSSDSADHEDEVWPQSKGNDVNMPMKVSVELNSQRDKQTMNLRHPLNHTKSKLRRITNFVDDLMPSSDLFTTHSRSMRFLTALYNEHDWVSVFTYGSLRNSRTLRFLKIVNDLLILTFFDALFYGVLFPDESLTCGVYFSEVDCLRPTSYYKRDETLCEWSSAGGCELRAPPSSLLFYAIVTLILTFLTVIPSLFVEFLLLEYCTCRPDMSDLGLDNEHWFRSSKYHTTVLNATLRASTNGKGNTTTQGRGVTYIVNHKRTKHLGVDECSDEKSYSAISMTNISSKQTSECSPDGVDVSLSTDVPGLMSDDYLCRTESVILNDSDRVSSHEEIISPIHNQSSLDLLPYDQNHSRLLQYYDHCSVEEEFLHARKLLSDRLAFQMSSVALPWLWIPSRDEDHYVQNVYSPESHVPSSLLQQIGIYADGTSAPTRLFQRLVHGDAASRLHTKIRRSRSQAASIVAELAQYDSVTELQSKDTALLQHFILEQFSRVKRYALRKQFFQFDTQPRLISFWQWLLIWIFLISLWTFCILYLLFWAASQGDTATTGFCVQFGLFLVQDLLVNQIVQIYIIHVLTIEFLRPQLKTINHVLNHVMLNKTSLSHDNISRKERHGISDVVQHVSGACRAARHSSLVDLPSARVLMNIDDRDVLLCRKVRKFKIGIWSYLIMGILGLLAVSNNFVTSLLLELVVPTLWCFFLLLNSFIFEVNYVVLLSIYCGGIVVFGFYIFAFSPARNFIRKAPVKTVRGRNNVFYRHRASTWIRSVRDLHQEKVRLLIEGQDVCVQRQSSRLGKIWHGFRNFFYKLYLTIHGCMVWIMVWSSQCRDQVFVSASLLQRETRLWRDLNSPRLRDGEDVDIETQRFRPQSIGIQIPTEVEQMRVAYRCSRGKNFWEVGQVESKNEAAWNRAAETSSPRQQAVAVYDECDMDGFDEVVTLMSK